MSPVSAENLFKTRPIEDTVQTQIYVWYSPTGLVSKNNIGARRIALNILLCKLRDALRHVI